MCMRRDPERESRRSEERATAQARARSIHECVCGDPGRKHFHEASSPGLRPITESVWDGGREGLRRNRKPQDRVSKRQRRVSGGGWRIGSSEAEAKVSGAELPDVSGTGASERSRPETEAEAGAGGKPSWAEKPSRASPRRPERGRGRPGGNGWRWGKPRDGIGEADRWPLPSIGQASETGGRLAAGAGGRAHAAEGDGDQGSQTE